MTLQSMEQCKEINDIRPNELIRAEVVVVGLFKTQKKRHLGLPYT